MKKLILLLAIAFAATPAFAEINLWEDGAKKLDLSGDFRFRYQNETKTSTTNANQQERFRLRIGMKYQSSEHVSAGFRLATKASSDHSTHHTFGKDDASTFGMDRAWIKYKRDGIKLLLGKAAPLQKQFSKAWIDSDYNPEGIGLAYSTGGDSAFNIHTSSYTINYQDYDAQNDTAIVVGLDQAMKFSDVKFAYTLGAMIVKDNFDATDTTHAIDGGSATYTYFGLQTGFNGFTVGAESFSSNVKDSQMGVGAEATDKAGMVAYLKYKINKTYALALMSYDLGEASLPLMGTWAQDDFPKSVNIAGTKVQVKYKGVGMNIDFNVYSVEAKNKNLTPAGVSALSGTGSITRAQVNFNVPF